MHEYGVPTHVPEDEPDVQPSSSEQRLEPESWEQVYSGVPLHVGPVEKKCVGLGAWTVAEVQQIRAAFEVQSALVLHDFGQLVEQMPSQQISPEAVWQSVDFEQVCGHGEYVGFRHNPSALRFGSTALTVVQQISPEPVLQSVLVLQVCGHSDGGRHTFWL